MRNEEIVEPKLEIIDAHHHLLDLPGHRYLFDELRADFESGHRVVASVHVQCRSMYRADGPPEMRCVGETEFVNGIAAQSASGNYGPTKACKAIVGTVDLLLGERAQPVLEAHVAAAGSRFRGIRPITAWHESDQIRGLDVPPHLLMEPAAHRAISCIQRLDLSLDLWLFFTQLDEAIHICRMFPDLKVIINHVGGPLGIGPYSSNSAAAFQAWREKMAALATCPNALIKLGGLGMRYCGFGFNELPQPPSSNLLVEKWKPYIEACIESFSADRCMFESNFPVDAGMCSYHVLWNAFKKLTAGYSVTERDRLFSRTAAETYRLDI
nr:amidohydrolase family protein [Variovorax paradoxus]